MNGGWRARASLGGNAPICMALVCLCNMLMKRTQLLVNLSRAPAIHESADLSERRAVEIDELSPTTHIILTYLNTYKLTYLHIYKPTYLAYPLIHLLTYYVLPKNLPIKNLPRPRPAQGCTRLPCA